MNNHSLRVRRLLLAFAGAFFIVGLPGLGCSPTASDESPTGAANQAIFNGEPDTNPAHLAVVALTDGPGTDYFCTGTLVSRKVVLTAGHCMHGVSASSVEIFFGSDVHGAGSYRPVAEGLTHPNYNNGQILDDIALLRLAVNAPSAVTPIPPLPASLAMTSADTGTDVDHSGFGLTESGDDGTKLHIALPIGLVCDGPGSCTYLGAEVNPRTFAYSMGPGGPCLGDSGGPAFLLRNGKEYVAGVTSYGDEPCLDYGVSTMVSAYESWIDDYVTAVDEEDCLAPGDEDGDGDADCADSDCAMDVACQGDTACTAATQVGCGDQVQGTTAGGSSTFTAYGCLSDDTEDGPERAFLFEAPAGVSATVTLTPVTGTGDLDLFVLPGQLAGCDPLSCLDASVNTGSDDESLTFETTAGGVYIVVDTYDGTPGDFDLSITCTGSQADSGAPDTGLPDTGLPDTGVPDASPGEDAGTTTDAGGPGPDAAAPEAGTQTPKSASSDGDDGGCGCRTGTSERTSSAGWVSLLLLLVLGARRRRG